MKWRMTFITLTIACGIAQADFLYELNTTRSDDYKYKLDLSSSRSRAGHAETAGLSAVSVHGGQGISPDNRHVRDWYQRIEESGALKTRVRDDSPEYR